MNEDKRKTEHIDKKENTQQPATTERLESIDYRDSQTAKEVYQVTQRNKNTTYKKGKKSQYLNKHKQIKDQDNISVTNPSHDIGEVKKENVSRKRGDKTTNRTIPPKKTKKTEVIKKPLKEKKLKHPIETHLKKDEIQSYIKENRSFFQSIWKKKK